MKTSTQPITKPLIHQAQLAIIYRDQQRLIRLKAQAKTLEEALEPAEKEVRAAIHEGHSIEPGEYTCAIATSSRKNVKWKDVVIAKCGQVVADEVTAATKPTPYEDLVVSKIG